MKLISVILLINCVYSVAATDCDLESIHHHLTRNMINTNFIQTKHIKSLSKPLISKGQLWMSPDQQLVWQTQVPILSTMVMSKNSMRMFNKYDKEINEARPQLITQIANMFITILNGESRNLKNLFEHKTSCNDKKWKLDLIPKDAELLKIINKISIMGSTSIERISYQEKRGDFTKVDLIATHPDISVQNATKFKVYLEH